MFNVEQIDEIKEYLYNVEDNSKIYLGSDSVKYKKRGIWYARYTVVLVVHIGQKHGAKVFSYTDKERTYDDIKNPRLRLMTEVYKVAECYLALADMLENFEVEVHLDLNSDEDHFSNKVVKEAVGYIRGVTGLDAKVKPESQVASHCADHHAKYQTWNRNTVH
jgi:uncharacterized protein